MARRADPPGEAWGPDGTQPVGGADATAAPSPPDDAGTSRGRPDPAPRPPDSHLPDSHLPDSHLPVPRLPPMPTAADAGARAAVENWMDDDRAAHRDDPPAQPYRVLRPAPPAPPPARRVGWDDEPGRARHGDDGPDEDPAVRALREEREFEAQFGPWRASTPAPPPMRRSTLVSPPVLVLGLVLLAVLYYALIR